LSTAFAEAYRLGTPADKFHPDAQAMQGQRPWQAPVWIAVGLLAGTNPKIPEVEELLAVGAAVQNMLLLAGAYGLGSKWTTGLTATHAHTAAFAGLAPPARLLGFVYAGWPAIPWPAGTRAGLATRVRWVTE
jgi:nitroreductase